ncbi:hypothetical protein PR048_011386 [Dryococelus australis]|uniref:Uncharacterized protein n=1 Tax=Dryococelus australis TaxID=614101 RepID=A0ABQ9HLY6_9NEOP|nr:hypothetical protein PR048_011386 [Dryococelus australis]
MKIYDCAEKFAKEDSIPGNDGHKCLKEAMADPILKVRLAASLISECEPFIERFKSQKLLVPFLYMTLEEVVRNLLMSKLMTLDLSNRLTCFYPKVLLFQSGLGMKRVDIFLDDYMVPKEYPKTWHRGPKNSTLL